MSKVYLEVDERSRLDMIQSLELLTLPPASRFRVLQKAGRQVRKASRENLRQQKTVGGRRMQSRKSGRGRVLKKIGRNLTTVTSDKKVDVTWKDKLEGMIAHRHQEGIPETFTAKKMQKIYGKPDYDQPATRKQAKAMLAAGFRIYAGKTRTGKTKSRKPSQRWIMENLTMGYAGMMVRTLRDEQANASWTVETPARPFLGVTEQQATAILAEELQRERERRSN
ncbi:hypothetical protein GZ77_07210 [Endozoicomonas montiporae]|uniref:Virion morphogenesis protein n=2 Tax=Endozoicomonas montiporae TaxID=1027273 RepID=A0A081N6Y7_9GAMM|nr:hypothetical protein [Endozoicomonas montiporae]AMO55983.1 phage protein [Endozoicomonas montiporae CL-33]KEQ14210.1 hypothetical protein GZ77_07210 [Endozoicomonas montiporae]